MPLDEQLFNILVYINFSEGGLFSAERSVNIQNLVGVLSKKGKLVMESRILLIQSLSFRSNGQSWSGILLNSVGVRQEAFYFLTFSSNTSGNSAAVSFCPFSTGTSIKQYLVPPTNVHLSRELSFWPALCINCIYSWLTFKRSVILLFCIQVNFKTKLIYVILVPFNKALF